MSKLAIALKKLASKQTPQKPPMSKLAKAVNNLLVKRAEDKPKLTPEQVQELKKLKAELGAQKNTPQTGVLPAIKRNVDSAVNTGLNAFGEGVEKVQGAANDTAEAAKAAVTVPYDEASAALDNAGEYFTGNKEEQSRQNKIKTLERKIIEMETGTDPVVAKRYAASDAKYRENERKQGIRQQGDEKAQFTRQGEVDKKNAAIEAQLVAQAQAKAKAEAAAQAKTNQVKQDISTENTADTLSTAQGKQEPDSGVVTGSKPTNTVLSKPDSSNGVTPESTAEKAKTVIDPNHPANKGTGYRVDELRAEDKGIADKKRQMGRNFNIGLGAVGGAGLGGTLGYAMGDPENQWRNAALGTIGGGLAGGVGAHYLDKYMNA